MLNDQFGARLKSLKLKIVKIGLFSTVRQKIDLDRLTIYFRDMSSKISNNIYRLKVANMQINIDSSILYEGKL